jgi:FkbM family methyltransferase
MTWPLPTSYKDRLRPVYHAVLNALSPEGNAIAINGTDTIKFGAVIRHPSVEHEPDVWHRLMDAVRPGDTCLDVGASIGLYTLGFANRLHGNGRVFSFEPDVSSYQALQRHILLNNFSEIVCAMNIAISDVNGVLKFVNGLGPTSHAAGPEEKASCVSVACFSLDNIFSGIGIVPDVAKIDVEGFELQVLRGAAGILSQARRPRLLYIDVHPWAWPRLGLETTNEALHDLLHSLGYKVEMRSDKYADIFAVSG